MEPHGDGSAAYARWERRKVAAPEEIDAVAGLGGLERQADRDVGVADAGRSCRRHVKTDPLMARES